MPATDFFGVTDLVKRLDPPAGYEDVHQDGYSWARAGTTYEDTTRLGPEAWNQLVANFRALLTIPGVVFEDADPRTPYLLRDVITAYIGIKGAALLPGVLISNIPALAADDDFMAAFAVAASALSMEREYAAADIADIGHAANTTGKLRGLIIWDTTNDRALRASGSLPADPWHVVDGSASITPA